MPQNQMLGVPENKFMTLCCSLGKNKCSNTNLGKDHCLAASRTISKLLSFRCYVLEMRHWSALRWHCGKLVHPVGPSWPGNCNYVQDTLEKFYSVLYNVRKSETCSICQEFGGKSELLLISQTEHKRGDV